MTEYETLLVAFARCDVVYELRLVMTGAAPDDPGVKTLCFNQLQFLFDEEDRLQMVLPIPGVRRGDASLYEAHLLINPAVKSHIHFARMDEDHARFVGLDTVKDT